MYQTNVQLIMGNHEAMLLSCAFVFDEMTEDTVSAYTAEKVDIFTRYLLDGGEVTLKAMYKLPKDIQQDILYYLRDCPLYEMIDVGGKTYFLVHSGIEKFDRNKKLNEYRDDQFLWARPDFDTRYFDDVMTILGHTPVIAFGKEYKDTIIKTDTWMDIDMGAGFGEEPVLLRLDDMKEFRL
jgi:serine/threonine protein phosphatase 1